MRILKLAGILVVLLSTRVHADTCTLKNFDVQIVTYWSAGASFDHMDERCDTHGDCRLQGWVVAPKTAGKHRAILWAHGSHGQTEQDEQKLDDWCEVFTRLVTANYVVFFPLRRGTFDTTSLPMVGGPVRLGNTGTYVNRTLGNRFGPNDSNDPNFDPGGYIVNTGWAAHQWADMMGGDDYDLVQGYYLNYLQDETSIDMNDALTKMTTLKSPTGSLLVDPAHVSFAGHSHGGAVATLASAVTTYAVQPVAFASLSGAAMAYYTSPWWPYAMNNAAAAHTRIIYFDRVLNEDPSTPQTFDSAEFPFEAAAGHDGGAVKHFYPAINISPDSCAPSFPMYWCVHGIFRLRPFFIDTWFPDFLQFLTNHA